MKKTSDSVLNIIGNTPMIKIDGIFAKLETVNPSGSTKDRLIAYLIERAEKRGELKQGQEIIECTSGNTGIALAMISAVKGYKFTAVMPESMSIERRKMIEGFGAKIILTPAAEDMIGAKNRYEEIVKKEKKAWLPRQFENQGNIDIHREVLGREIIEQMDGQVDAFCAAVGTGGTLLGVAEALKKINPKVQIVAIEPAESAVMSGGKPGIHKIQGIGEGFIPQLAKDNMEWIDAVVAVKSGDAIRESKELMKKHGLMVGISSGANVIVASDLARKYKRVVTILPDRGERYLSEV